LQRDGEFTGASVVIIIVVVVIVVVGLSWQMVALQAEAEEFDGPRVLGERQDQHKCAHLGEPRQYLAHDDHPPSASMEFRRGAFA
jgi:hypothetical protein